MMAKANVASRKDAYRQHRPMTFDEWCAQFTLTAAERTALVWHLAACRARRTVETLIKPSKSTPEQ